MTPCTGDQIKCTITLNKITDFSEVNIVGNAWNNESTQLNKIDNMT